MTTEIAAHSKRGEKSEFYKLNELKNSNDQTKK
jgi:hypothetical protein